MGNGNGNWTPVFDSIVKTHGVMGALIYGRMLRYSQMQDGVCKASVETIAKELGINRMTVIRAQERLDAAGLIVDLTPDLRNKPHVHRIIAITECDSTNSAITNSDSTLSQIVTPAITNSDLNHTLKETIQDTKEVVGVSAGKEKQFATSTDALQAWIKVTGMPTFPTREQDTIIEAVCNLWHGSATATADYLRPFWLAWIGKKSKNGRPYSRTNPSWLDWAIAGEIPKEPTNGNGTEKRAIRHEGAG